MQCLCKSTSIISYWVTMRARTARLLLWLSLWYSLFCLPGCSNTKARLLSRNSDALAVRYNCRSGSIFPLTFPFNIFHLFSCLSTTAPFLWRYTNCSFSATPGCAIPRMLFATSVASPISDLGIPSSPWQHLSS